MSTNQYKPQSLQLASTLRVCEKIIQMNRTREERKALRKRLRYEMKKALELAEWNLAFKYFVLLLKS